MVSNINLRSAMWLEVKANGVKCAVRCPMGRGSCYCKAMAVDDWPLTSIVAALTLPKLHLATWNKCLERKYPHKSYMGSVRSWKVAIPPTLILSVLPREQIRVNPQRISFLRLTWRKLSRNSLSLKISIAKCPWATRVKNENPGG